uniref:TATA-box-binding protein n=1 Tax=Meloidogyne incognita TaxID=6306 RepID=A0A914MC49_MELIC
MYQKAFLQNIVSTAQLIEGTNKIDLQSLANKISEAKYHPKRFSALTIKLKYPMKATGLLFSNGRIVCVGTKSVKDSEIAIRHFVQIIKEAISISIEMRGFRIQNVVSSFSFPGPLNLPALYDSMRYAPPIWLAKHISYNPEFFPGMCLRLKESRAVIIVFTTGKCIITGAKSEEEIYSTQNKIYNSISAFIKK